MHSLGRFLLEYLFIAVFWLRVTLEWIERVIVLLGLLSNGREVSDCHCRYSFFGQFFYFMVSVLVDF